jgi:two-component system CheB/CheR fusion protein
MCCGAFFRTPQAFTALKAWVVEDLLDCATPEKPARIWIPACGTGEEAYSIAMLLIEHFQTYGRQLNLRVFATDAETNSIEVARAGVYAESDMIGVSAQRLQRFFQHYGSNRLQVTAALRDCVVFATHDLENDPPLSRLDFVHCLDALGQLAAGNRTNLYSLLHFALNEGGHLLLDPGETIAPSEDLFQPVDAEGYVYRRLGAAHQPAPAVQYCAPAGRCTAHGGGIPIGTRRPGDVAGEAPVAE